MNILIPINNEKNLCSMEENSSWAVATLDEGQTQNLQFFKTREEINEFTEYVVVISKDEFVSDFFLEGIGILIAPMQRTIEDIVEAYMFRELHEVTS
jgi:hypothetical protein